MRFTGATREQATRFEANATSKSTTQRWLSRVPQKWSHPWPRAACGGGVELHDDGPSSTRRTSQKHLDEGRLCGARVGSLGLGSGSISAGHERLKDAWTGVERLSRPVERGRGSQRRPGPSPRLCEQPQL